MGMPALAGKDRLSLEETNHHLKQNSVVCSGGIGTLSWLRRLPGTRDQFSQPSSGSALGRRGWEGDLWRLDGYIVAEVILRHQRRQARPRKSAETEYNMARGVRVQSA